MKLFMVGSFKAGKWRKIMDDINDILNSETVKKMTKTVTDAAEPYLKKAEPYIKNVMEKAEPIIEDAKQKAEPIIEDTKTKAKPIIDDVKKKAEPIIEDAKQKAEPIIEDAKQKAKPIIKKVKKQSEPATKAVKKVAEAAAAAGSDVADMTALKLCKNEVFVQYEDHEIRTSDLLERAQTDYISKGHRAVDLHEFQIYIKPGDNAAYYVVNHHDTGKINVF